MSNIHQLRAEGIASRVTGELFQDPLILDGERISIFEVDGVRYSHAEMREANADDEDLCNWLDCARVGDVYPAVVECRRVA